MADIIFVGRILILLFIGFFTGIFSACTANNIPYSHYGQPSTGSPNNAPNNGNPNSPPPNLSDAEARTSNFLYELIPDTLTALTCPYQQSIGNGSFTLSLGAYTSHGLQLSRDFLKSYDITEDTPYQKVRQLVERSPFKNARARLALQDESNLNVVFSNSGNNPIKRDFPIFNNPQTLDHLSRLRPVFTSRSSSRNLVNSGGSFTASLPITGSDLIHFAPGLAERTVGQPMLTLTYTLNGTHSIYNTDRVPYGKGYKLEFADSYRANYLIDVREEDLVTRRSEKWLCPDNLKFMVHRATRREDSHFNRERERYGDNVPEEIVDEGYCYTGKNLTADEKDFFETVFGTSQSNSLPFEVGETVVIRGGASIITNQPCIKFKRPGCYLAGRGFYRIEFDPNKLDDCILNRQIEYRQASNEEFYRICPAFLSVCYRDD